MAGVTAPIRYYHFGSVDGLLSAAITEAFAQFLASKKAEVLSVDPLIALRQGWDNYVRFAAARPRLYAAMFVRVLQGASIPAADAARGLLRDRIAAVATDGRLAMDAQSAADLIWASANALKEAVSGRCPDQCQWPCRCCWRTSSGQPGVAAAPRIESCAPSPPGNP